MKLLPRSMLTRLGWTTGAFGVTQVLRLLGNVALARLLAPELFGLMLIVTTLRTGIELLSDIGVGQNIVSNPRATEPDFYNTAWTLQVMRGLSLALLCLGLAWPIAWFYRNPELGPIFAVASLIFVFTGLESTGRFIAQKRLDVRRLGMFEIGCALLSLVANVGLAIVTPTVWALVFGGAISAAGMLIGSFLITPGIRHRLTLDASAMREILSFGRWVFLSSIVYFLSMNFDRLYVARAAPLAVLGVYGIARSLADILNQMVARLGNMIVFPMVAGSGGVGPELRRRLARYRPLVMLAAAAAVAAFAAGSDLIIAILYDARYQSARVLLPTLSLGVWFAIMATINESVLMGIGKPVYGASANLAKFVWIVIGLPIAMHFHGIAGAAMVIATAEMARYVPLWWAQKREHLSFARQDLAMTMLMIGLTVAFREALWSLGLGGDVASMLPWH